MFLTVLIYLLNLTTTTKAEEHGVFFKVEEDHFLFDKNTVWNEKVNSLLHCSQICGRRDDCKAANFMTEQRICSLFSEGQTRNPKGLLKRKGCSYLEKVDSPEKQESPELMNSCLKLLQNGFKYSGVYHIIPDGGKPMQVLCDMTTDGGGWTVFQRRLDGSVDFSRGWESYKNGFGDLNGEFWLGNDNLHRLTTADDVKLRVDLEDFDGDIRYAEYTTFNVADGGDKYRLLIGGYNGTAGDSMAQSTGMQFSTKDADNDLHSVYHCAKMLKGSWWHKHCTSANLNGVYHGGPYSRSNRDGVRWFTFKGNFYSLKRTEMKLKPKP